MLFSLCATVVVYLYTTTYFHSIKAIALVMNANRLEMSDSSVMSTAETLAEKLQDQSEDLGRIHIERKILIGCISLFSGLIICYMPSMVAHIISDFTEVPVDPVVVGYADAFSDLDTLVTPIVSLCFQTDFRNAVVEFYFTKQQRIRSNIFK
ncbi:hypothetical protein BCR33DRAFT_724269 [Rhizoclosmatium globosum]|uniref:G protein-coupled receptor n=1 Tax=Rhizoclosmatium globosum TaxID=329046 RepID=A0A1Y2B7T0_9FUNG|nr:hypothetical protein BCR33DRAFT_724269 [Rhizoclosmatium globosum]|eukprot:ORY30746.1 hypothetical protein BCR33DRAFT_724269 [Rhizoclosmatium globosum]